MMLAGRVWKLGDNVSATDLLPAAYDRFASRGEWASCAPHVLEFLLKDFACAVKPGDIVVGGANLGSGHAHYHRGGALGPRAAGIVALFGDSVNGLYLRGAIDEGYAVWPIAGISSFIADGDELEVDLAAGSARNLTQGTTMAFTPVDPIILAIWEAGSAMDWALRRKEMAA